MRDESPSKMVMVLGARADRLQLQEAHDVDSAEPAATGLDATRLSDVPSVSLADDNNSPIAEETLGDADTTRGYADTTKQGCGLEETEQSTDTTQAHVSPSVSPGEVPMHPLPRPSSIPLPGPGGRHALHRRYRPQGADTWQKPL